MDQYEEETDVGTYAHTKREPPPPKYVYLIKTSSMPVFHKRKPRTLFITKHTLSKALNGSLLSLKSHTSVKNLLLQQIKDFQLCRLTPSNCIVCLFSTVSQITLLEQLFSSGSPPMTKSFPAQLVTAGEQTASFKGATSVQRLEKESYTSTLLR